MRKIILLIAVLLLPLTLTATAQAVGTNDVATTVLLNGGTFGDSQIMQGLLLAESDLIKRDQMTQQFTPSMAAASFALMEQGNAFILEQVAGRLAMPWDSGMERKKFLRGQESYYSAVPSHYSSKAAASPDSGWLRFFGYGGEQTERGVATNTSSSVANAAFAGYKTAGFGFTFGFDKKYWGDKMLCGLAYGYTNNDLTSTPFVGGAATPAEVHVDTHTALGYAAVRTGARTYLATKLGGTWGIVDGVRRPFTEIDRLYSYDTSAATWFFQATFGWNAVENSALDLTPKARIAYFGMHQSAYEENRGTQPPSQIDALISNYTQFDLVADLTLHLAADLLVDLSLGYRGLSGAEGAVLNTQMDGLTYPVVGISPAKHQFLFDLGGSWMLTERISMLGEYNFRTGEGSSLHGGTLTGIWEF